MSVILTKPIVVCFDNHEITCLDAKDVESAVRQLLCSYCTCDYKFTTREKEDKVKVKVTAIEKFRFPEHQCKNNHRPYHGRTKYIKVKE